ncbi:MAG: hypothetical protein ACRENB_01030 [Gemmatimonadales bacterium]
MSEPPSKPDEVPPPDAPVEADTPPPGKRWWRRWKLWLAVALLTPVLLFTCYTLVTLTWSYSEGQRSGVLQKLSRRGWICKTWEGELAMTTQPGVAPTIWSFSVRKDVAARQLSTAIGRRVVLYYQEHQGIPTTCFGDTRYFIDSVRVVGP